jgi:hypothetical protein
MCAARPRNIVPDAGARQMLKDLTAKAEEEGVKLAPFMEPALGDHGRAGGGWTIILPLCDLWTTGTIS